ncbi:MAG: hypothetical protein Tsb0018_04200 [Opitutales bacterium]
MEMSPASTRAPLLWGLLPLMGGILLEGLFPNFMGIPMLLGLASLCLIIGYCVRYKSLKRISWIAAGVLLAIAYTSIRIPQRPEEAKLPPRESELSIKITKLYPRQDAPGRYIGRGRIVEAPIYVDYLQGTQVAFVLKGEAHAAHKGETWKVRGVIEPLPTNTKAFSYTNTLSHTGTYFRLYRGELLKCESKAGLISQGINRAQNYLTEILMRSRPETSSGIYTAMLLGKKGTLDPSMKEAFVQSGTFHIFAISGLHIGVIAGALFFVLRWLRLSSISGALLGLGILLAYVIITGASASAMRAYLMASFLWGAHIALRRPAPFAALVASALIALLMSPAQLWEPGFQLSYSVVTGILLYGLPLSKALKTKLNRLTYLVPKSSISQGRKALTWAFDRSLESAAITWSATLYSLPLIVAYFHIISPGGIFLNLILVPLASLTIVLGFFSIFFGLFFLGWISAGLNILASGLITCLQGLALGTMKLHGLFWEATLRGPAWAWIGLGSLILIILIQRKHRNKRPKYHYWLPPAAVCLWIAVAIAPQSWVAL